MSRQPVGWYVRRLRRMSPTELTWRARDQVRRTAWSRRQMTRDRWQNLAAIPTAARQRSPGVLGLPAGTADQVPESARKAIIATADAIMAGELEVLGVLRTDLRTPDWFHDPITGRRSDPGQYAFRVNHRAEEQVGNIKQVWELSRHHHLSQLAAAWYLTHDDGYAERAATHLRSWWRENPFLSGVHWTSGIEVGIRLISWTWTRRLLDGWSAITGLFDANEVARRQISWHQEYLAAFRSRGSSANNHVIAEAAGQLVASCGFPWFPQSERWRVDAAEVLQRELAANTFPSGINRELATDYHRFVAELGLVAAVEADAAGHPLRDETWSQLTRMFDAAAALVDRAGRPPRQGDDDEGRVLVLDPPDPHNWSGFLSLGAAVVGPAGWWPESAPDATSVVVGAVAGHSRKVADSRPPHRPSHFADAGITLLRTPDNGKPEIWCRCDGGPHGFLSIAGHAHADALSIELRVDGVDVLADPGTYCYHGEEAWRNYFRSTIAHNTVELDRRDQSTSGGPFLWLRHATGRTTKASVDDAGNVVAWSAEHNGYTSLDTPAVHRRDVGLDAARQTLRITDHVESDVELDIRMAYHLGPDVHADLEGNGAHLHWPARNATAHATLELPDALTWTAHRGETDPILGWYSPRFGHKVPAAMLLGIGKNHPGASLTTVLRLRKV